MNDEYTYQVSVTVEIRRVGPSGQWTNDTMRFENKSDLGSLNFAQIADLLMRFNDINQNAVESIKAQK